MFIGYGTLVAGARSDVEALYEGTTPRAYLAGWGYMLLTNFLPDRTQAPATPNGGNGTFTLYAYAIDFENKTSLLGSKTITLDNAHATKPFGAIDTPGQGGTASGGAFVNFGWALTPLPAVIPIDGSTITVYVDGVLLGNATYNQFRSDIAGAFPGYDNSNGAVGFRVIDTTALANGVHTIGWLVYDNLGRGDGIGSRFFSVANGSGDLLAEGAPVGWAISARPTAASSAGPSPRSGSRPTAALPDVNRRPLEAVEIRLPGPATARGHLGRRVRGGRRPARPPAGRRAVRRRSGAPSRGRPPPASSGTTGSSFVERKADGTRDRTARDRPPAPAPADPAFGGRPLPP